jgi:hypothetical protein
MNIRVSPTRQAFPLSGARRGTRGCFANLEITFSRLDASSGSEIIGLISSTNNIITPAVTYSTCAMKHWSCNHSAKQLFYHWAWVDTCCIDQTNNVTVQRFNNQSTPCLFGIVTQLLRSSTYRRASPKVQKPEMVSSWLNVSRHRGSGLSGHSGRDS